MKINTNLDLTEALKPALPEGEYVLEYINDGFSNGDSIIEIVCKVLQTPVGKEHLIGEKVKIATVYSSTNKQLVAIGNSVRNQIFKACLGRVLFEALCANNTLDTNKLKGLKFGCFIDIKETEIGFSAQRNRFSKFKTVATNDELLEICKQRFPELL